jgi:hypothetical protein
LAFVKWQLSRKGVTTMTEYTVHFQKGFQVGARRIRMVPAIANSVAEAIKLARADFSEPGFKLVRVDHFDPESGRLIID